MGPRNVRTYCPCLFLKNCHEDGSLKPKHVANYVLMIIYIYIYIYIYMQGVPGGIAKFRENIP